MDWTKTGTAVYVSGEFVIIGTKKTILKSGGDANGGTVRVAGPWKLLRNGTLVQIKSTLAEAKRRAEIL